MRLLRAFQFLRGAASLCVVWASLWAVTGVALHIVAPQEPMRLTITTLLRMAAAWAIPGAIAGAVFALILAVSGRRHIAEFTMRRTIAWGALAGVLIPLSLALGSELRAFTGVPNFALRALLTLVGVGGLSAAATLALARRAQRDPLPPMVDPSQLHGATASPPSDALRSPAPVADAVAQSTRRDLRTAA